MIRLIFNHFRSIRFLIKKQRAKKLYSISGLINPLTAYINDNFYVNTECEEYFSKYFDEQQPYSKSSMILKYFVFFRSAVLKISTVKGLIGDYEI